MNDPLDAGRNEQHSRLRFGCDIVDVIGSGLAHDLDLTLADIERLRAFEASRVVFFGNTLLCGGSVDVRGFPLSRRQATSLPRLHFIRRADVIGNFGQALFLIGDASEPLSGASARSTRGISPARSEGTTRRRWAVT
jgi:hypothetical protein